MGRFDRRWSPDEVDLYAAQWAETDAVDTSMVHACLAVDADGECRLQSLCDLLDAPAGELADRHRFETLGAAADSAVPLCSLCGESGVFAGVD